MINKLFPFKLHLKMLQLEEYEILRFLNWILKHFLKRSTDSKKKLVWTAKAKTIFLGSIFVSLFLLALLTILFSIPGFILGLIFFSQPYLSLSITALLLKPLEFYIYTKTKNKTTEKLDKLKTKVIGITGSYGKTSVKEFLYQILKTEYKVLKTPESYNTVFGIAKVVDLELDSEYDFFICEMGAYKKGDIKELAKMVKPSFGILTGLNEQHLERFGSQEKIIETKFELFTNLKKNPIRVANIDNELIKNNIYKYADEYIAYGFNNTFYTIKDIKFTPNGSIFTLVLNKKELKANTNLVGNSNLQNILGAATMAHKLGVSAENIIKAISQLSPVPHRLEFRKQNDTIIIDDAYNSNVNGFQEALSLLNSYPNKKKILVTPGIIELGHKTKSVHQDLGKIIDEICDDVFLIGENERTFSLAEGIKKKLKIKFLKSISEFWPLLEKNEFKNAVILIENDLPDNY